jgi:hypothetical protein
MKKLILTLVTTLTLLTTFSQNRVWVTIPNIESARPELLSMNISSVEKAFPSSRKENLQNVYELTSEISSQVIIESLKKRNDLFINPEVGPNYQTLDIPNDYYVSFSNQWALEMIEANEAWDLSKGSLSTIIAITDANYHINHEELVGKYDYITPNNTNTNYSHGTAVAVIAGGNTNNSVGTSSIGYNSRLQLRVMNYNELLNATYSGAKVINASWASGCSFSFYGQEVINEVYENGSVVVASAGNGSTCGGSSNLVYPASFENVISVTSIGVYNNHERIIGDPNSTHQHNSMVDICAPGYDVPLTVAPGTYLTGNGSSFASPFVSGTIALMLSVNPCLSVDDIEYILKETADTNVYTTNPQYQGLLGSGTLNSHLAVHIAKNFSNLSGSFTETVDCTVGKKFLGVSNLDGVSPYTYEWNNGEINQTTVVNTDTIFSVIITDNNGCKFVDSTYVEKYQEMTDTMSVDNVNCYGNNDGSITINIYGGTNVQDAVWNNGFVGNTITNLSEGQYSFTVVDGYDCSLIDTIRVNEPEQLTSTITFVNPTITTNGSIDITVNGGSLPYTYQWNNGETTEDLTNISSDFYELLIIDANGCMTSENVMLNMENTSSVNELSTNDMIVYPNPSNGSVTIKNTNGNYSDLIVTNVNGQTVYSEQMFNNEVSINDLSQGIYMITVGNTTQKLIVK